jgi:hypothetical protein
LSAERWREASYRLLERLDHHFARRIDRALLLACACIGVILVLATLRESIFGAADNEMVTLPNGAKIAKSYLTSPQYGVAPQPLGSANQEHDAEIDTQRTEFLKWFEHTSVCMRRAADLEIRSLKLSGKDVADDATILKVTDYTRMMCGEGLRAFLTKRAGYSIPDADSLLDRLAERMVKERAGKATRAETPPPASRMP